MGKNVENNASANDDNLSASSPTGNVPTFEQNEAALLKTDVSSSKAGKHFRKWLHFFRIFICICRRKIEINAFADKIKVIKLFKEFIGVSENSEIIMIIRNHKIKYHFFFFFGFAFYLTVKILPVSQLERKPKNVVQEKSSPEKDWELVPPDGGWGWLILAG